MNYFCVHFQCTTYGGQRSAALESQDGNVLWEKSEISDIAYCDSAALVFGLLIMSVATVPQEVISYINGVVEDEGIKILKRQDTDCRGGGGSWFHDFILFNLGGLYILLSWANWYTSVNNMAFNDVIVTCPEK